jgi:hypothetical protein
VPHAMIEVEVKDHIYAMILYKVEIVQARVEYAGDRGPACLNPIEVHVMRRCVACARNL